jgi:predicted aldo/keto reductase-like oxidoreductase
MIYREYGQTGKKISLLGFGGMRFANIDDHESCVRMMLAAAQGGVNYFDTAPAYFGVKSEEVYGKGFLEFKKQNLQFFSATKTFASTESAIKREIDGQLKRMNISSIDFYHVWCIADLEGWQSRKRDGVIKAFVKLKEEGLIQHICVSSHLVGNEIRELLMEGIFEGVLFGYSAYNFNTRQEAFNAIRNKKLGAVVMNPLGGGLIPQHPEQFRFLQSPGESIVAAALRFLWDHPDITSTLVGFNTLQQVKEALQAIDGYKSRSTKELSEIKKQAGASMEGVCTGCGYCDKCPQGIPIPKYMDAYNQILLKVKNDNDPIGNRLKWHWHLERTSAGKCIACGLCEKACTQHINIVERLKEIAG